MREIKFRAWDRDHGFMHNDVLIDGDGTVYTSALKVYDTPNREIERLSEDQAYVMQFTGLTDKNGKEIYEGDIIRREVHVGKEREDTAEQIFQVVWSDEYAGFEPLAPSGWTPILMYVVQSGVEVY